MNPLKETTNQTFNISEDNFENTITRGIVIREFKGFIGALNFLNKVGWKFKTSQLEKTRYLIEYNLPKTADNEKDLILAIHEAI